LKDQTEKSRHGHVVRVFAGVFILLEGLVLFNAFYGLWSAPSMASGGAGVEALVRDTAGVLIGSILTALSARDRGERE
jgi:hypothetical protein